MKYVILALYLIVSAIHLYHSWLDDAKHRAMTKPFLLLLLAAYYVVAAGELNWFLLLALLTSWLGDVLLIPKGHKWFTMGGISFLASHIFFVAVYFPSVRFASVPMALVVGTAIVYVGIALAIICAVRKTTPKPMVVPMYLYLVANSTMNIFAMMRMFTMGTIGSIVAYIGALLFFASDCTLFLVRYHKNKYIISKRHFPVMLTYLAGEMLIVMGILMN